VKSVVLFTCGVRPAHFLEGLEWTLSGNPLVHLTTGSLEMMYHTSDYLQKG
jgi:hypothetical protein